MCNTWSCPMCKSFYVGQCARRYLLSIHLCAMHVRLWQCNVQCVIHTNNHATMLDVHVCQCETLTQIWWYSKFNVQFSMINDQCLMFALQLLLLEPNPTPPFLHSAAIARILMLNSYYAKQNILIDLHINKYKYKIEGANTNQRSSWKGAGAAILARSPSGG